MAFCLLSVYSLLQLQSISVRALKQLTRTITYSMYSYRSAVESVHDYPSSLLQGPAQLELVCKDAYSKNVASGAAAKDDDTKFNKSGDTEEDEEVVSTKAHVMTLFTTDVVRVSGFAWHLFILVDAPLEIIIGAIFL